MQNFGRIDIINLSDRIINTIELAIKNEKARSILIVEAEDYHYANRITVSGNCYIHHAKHSHISELKQKYDLIFCDGMPKNLTPDEETGAVELLLDRAETQLMLLVPEQSKEPNANGEAKVSQKYGPLFFRSFNFTYVVFENQDDNLLLYSFFPVRFPSRNKDMPMHCGPGITGRLRIAYILPDQDLTGGMKQLLEQMREMYRRGHEVYAYLKDDFAQSALPEWSNIDENDVSGQMVIPADANFIETMLPADIIILGWMKLAPEFAGSTIPVVLWEQGSGFLFGDYGRPIYSCSREFSQISGIYQSPVHLMAVSPLIKTILKARFGRESLLLSAGIDTEFYRPAHRSNKLKRILLVGNANKKFKNFGFALRALSLAAKNRAKFSVAWACQSMDEGIDTYGLAIDYHIMPSQQQLVGLYQQADIFISVSQYEAFSLPPLEAMACKTAVLAVDNGGIKTYAVSGENCILCNQGDLIAFVESIHLLLEDDEKREDLAYKGYLTSSGYSVSAMADALEQNLDYILQVTTD